MKMCSLPVGCWVKTSINIDPQNKPQNTLNILRDGGRGWGVTNRKGACAQFDADLPKLSKLFTIFHMAFSLVLFSWLSWATQQPCSAYRHPPQVWPWILPSQLHRPRRPRRRNLSRTSSPLRHPARFDLHGTAIRKSSGRRKSGRHSCHGKVNLTRKSGGMSGALPAEPADGFTADTANQHTHLPPATLPRHSAYEIVVYGVRGMVTQDTVVQKSDLSK